MAKKIKKKKMVPTQDPQLEQVEEDRAIELEYDESTNEVVLVCHYRRHWGDGFDADVEHLYSLEENEQMIAALLNLLEIQRKVRAQGSGVNLPEISTLQLQEGNPIQEGKLDTKDGGSDAK